MGSRVFGKGESGTQVSSQKLLLLVGTNSSEDGLVDRLLVSLTLVRETRTLLVVLEDVSSSLLGLSFGLLEVVVIDMIGDLDLGDVDLGGCSNDVGLVDTLQRSSIESSRSWNPKVRLRGGTVRTYQ